MLVEENAGKTEEDRLIERAKDPPYNFALVPECHQELRDSVAIRVTSRRMCTFSIGEMFHLCNEAARRRTAEQRPEGWRVQSENPGACAAVPFPGLAHNAPEQLQEPDTFSAGEIIQCPGCLKNMKAPMRARALRCANCRAEIYPGHRKPGVSGRLRHKNPVPQADNDNPPLVAARQRRAGSVQSPRGYDKPLSLDYIADRLDIDNPLRGYMIRHKTGGWLQGFILITTFTTWQRWFRWDSLAHEAGLVEAHQLGALSVWDDDGKLTAQMESLPRSGDPEKEGVIWGRIAELSLLGGLKCGRFLLQLALEEMEADDEYDFLVLQATETSRSFYEGLGFVRVGAIAKASLS